MQMHKRSFNFEREPFVIEKNKIWLINFMTNVLNKKSSIYKNNQKNWKTHQ